MNKVVNDTAPPAVPPENTFKSIPPPEVLKFKYAPVVLVACHPPLKNAPLLIIPLSDVIKIPFAVEPNNATV